MKKLVLIFFLALLVSAPAFAQKNLRFGIRGGFDLIDQTIDLSSSNRTGYHLGLSMDANIPLLPFGVEASVLYTYRKIDTNDNSYSVDNSRFLDIPVNLKYSIGLGGLGIVFSAGPYIRFNLDGGDINYISETYKAKTFQAGLNFGGGLDLGRHFYVGVCYFTSLTDCYADDKGDIGDVFDKKPDRMSLTATYYF